MARKTTPLPIKQPPAGSDEDDDSSSSEEADSFSDDASNAKEDPSESVSIGFGCPIIEEPFHKP